MVWAPDGRRFVTRDGGKVVQYDVATQKTRDVAATASIDNAAVRAANDDGPMDWTNRRARTGGMEWTADEKSLLFTSGGDLFLIEIASGKWEQLTRTPEPELDAKLSPDGKMAAYRRGWDLYAVDLATRKETRLTTGGTELVRNGALDWVYPEELNLPTAFWWAPDGKAVAYLQFDVREEPVVPQMDLLRTRAPLRAGALPAGGRAQCQRAAGRGGGGGAAKHAGMSWGTRAMIS